MKSGSLFALIIDDIINISMPVLFSDPLQPPTNFHTVLEFITLAEVGIRAGHKTETRKQGNRNEDKGNTHTYTSDPLL